MKPAITLGVLSAFLLVGCNGNKTPEEIEAAKYPQTPALTAEQQAYVDAKSKEPWKKIPPPGGEPSTSPQ